MSTMSTGNSNEKDSPTTGPSVESHKEEAMPGEKIGINKTSKLSNTGVENSLCNYCEQDELENEKNRNKDQGTASDSKILDNGSNNNSSELSKTLAEEKSSECLKRQKHLLDETVHGRQTLYSKKLVSLADIIHQISGGLTSDTKCSSKTAVQDRAEQKVECSKGESFKCQDHFLENTDIAVCKNQQEIDNDGDIVRGVKSSDLRESGEHEENQNNFHDGSLALECQKKTKVEEKDITSNCNHDRKTDDISCKKEMEVMENTVIGLETLKTENTEWQPDKQLYSLDSIRNELTNVKNALAEENCLEKGKEETSRDSSDLEESSGTVTSSTESDDEASSSSYSDDEGAVSRAVVAAMEEEEARIHQTPPKTRDEITVMDLPAEPELDIKIDEQVKLVETGEVTSVVETLMVVKAITSTPALDIDTVLFLKDKKPLGKVFEVFGPVQSPYYAIRFNSEAEAKEKNITHGTKVFYCPDSTECTKFVFTAQLKKIKGSDASWKFDQEPPEEIVEYSDDDEEAKAKAKKRHEKRTQNPGNKGHLDRAENLGGQPSKQSRGSKEFTPGKQSRQARLVARPSQQHHPPFSGGFGLPPPRPGECSQATMPRAVFQPGHFAGPPPYGHIQGPRHVPPGEQFCPRPLQSHGPRGLPTEFQHFSPSFVIPAERPFGNRLPVQGVTAPQPPGQLRASIKGQHPNLLLQRYPPTMRNIPSPYGNPTAVPMPQGTFNRAPSPCLHNRMSMGLQSDERAAMYLPPPPPPPPPPPLSQPPNNPHIPPM